MHSKFCTNLVIGNHVAKGGEKDNSFHEGKVNHDINFNLKQGKFALFNLFSFYIPENWGILQSY